jgi:hypothetical protein
MESHHVASTRSKALTFRTEGLCLKQTACSSLLLPLSDSQNRVLNFNINHDDGMFTEPFLCQVQIMVMLVIFSVNLLSLMSSARHSDVLISRRV